MPHYTVYPIPLKPKYRKDHARTEIKYALNWVQDHKASPDICDGAKKFSNPRPIWSDIIEGNYKHYSWKSNGDEKGPKEYDKNTLAFARSIMADYDSSSVFRPHVCSTSSDSLRS